MSLFSSEVTVYPTCPCSLQLFHVTRSPLGLKTGDVTGGPLAPHWPASFSVCFYLQLNMLSHSRINLPQSHQVILFGPAVTYQCPIWQLPNKQRSSLLFAEGHGPSPMSTQVLGIHQAPPRYLPRWNKEESDER